MPTLSSLSAAPPPIGDIARTQRAYLYLTVSTERLVAARTEYETAVRQHARAVDDVRACLDTLHAALAAQTVTDDAAQTVTDAVGTFDAVRALAFGGHE